MKFCNLTESKITDARMRRIIIRGLKPEYNGFITAIQGWPTQPTILELESLLTNQESLEKQMAGVTLKETEEALFSSWGRFQNNKQGKEHQDKSRQDSQGKQNPSNCEQDHDSKRTFHNCSRAGHFVRDCRDLGPKKTCYICDKPGHFARDCCAPRRNKKPAEGNAATSADNDHKKDESEEEWSVYLSTLEEQPDVFNGELETLALTVIDMELGANLAETCHSNRIDYSRDWIVDSGC